MNEKRIFEKYYLTNRTYLNLQDFVLTENLQKKEFVSKIENYPLTTYYGQEVLELTSYNVKAEEYKTAEISIEEIDIEDKDALAIGFNTKGAGELLERMRITLVSEGASDYTDISLIADRWSYILLDIKQFKCVGKAKKLVFSRYSVAETQYVCKTQIAEIYFGNILDFHFLRGNYTKFIDGNIIPCENGGFVWYFNENEVLDLPNLERPKYTYLNMRLSVKDTVLVVAEADKDIDAVLRFNTDLNKEYKEIPLTFKSGLNCVSAYLKAFDFTNDERLYSIKFIAKTNGNLKIKEISLEQEDDFLEDKRAVEYLSKPYKKVVNPYAFTLNCFSLSVKDFGATGNGYTDDTESINKAIEEVVKQGGGKVIFPRGRYRATHIVLKSNIELHLEQDAIIIQSDRAKDYPYDIAFEHDSVTAKSPWPHNFLVHNLPLIYGKGVCNVKITGEGKIRMMDSGNEEKLAGFPYYPIHCEGVLHLIPIAMVDSENVEVSGITINRANSYHMSFFGIRNLFINEVKCFDTRCLSADGIGLGMAKNVYLANTMVITNDDCVTLSPIYNDPRSGGWWICTPGQDNSVRNIEIDNCYLNSAYGGGGKAIAFIPWGKNAKNQEYQQIQDIYVHDCILNGGHSVGTWCDDPFHGKVPFDNTETDDYSPIKNIRIFNNEYLSICDLLTVLSTDTYSDCGLKSSYKVINGDFRDYLSNWNYEGAIIKNGVCVLNNGYIKQGLNFKKGERKVSAEIIGDGELSVSIKDTDIIYKGNPVIFTLNKDTDIYVEIKGSCKITDVKSE